MEFDTPDDFRQLPEHIRKLDRANILPVATGEPPPAGTMRDILQYLSARNCFAKRSGIEKDEADRIFAVLADGGQVKMPLGKTFFSPRFGMVEDRFGVLWIVILPA